MDEFGQYRIEGLIGAGGMGEVYRAHDTRRDRQVALKLLPSALSTDPEYQRRFQRESFAVARLREPHVVPIHDYGEIDGRLYIDMRLVDGPNLGVLIAEDGPMAPERAVNLMSQAAEALDAAHADGVVHRDVKPSNILVTANDFVYVVDFGIAHPVGHTRSRLTMTGASLGTLDYMAPERFENQPVDPRTDVYSLACVLFECLTAQKPFSGDDLPALMYAHLHLSPPRVSAINPAAGAELDAVVAKGMAKKPGDRYATTGALAAAARAALNVAHEPTEHVEELTRRVEPDTVTARAQATPVAVGVGTVGVGAVGVGAGLGAAVLMSREHGAPRGPEMRYDDPAPRYDDPASRYDDSTSRYDDPAPRYEDPAPRYEDPAPRYDDPAPRYDDHRSRYDDGAGPTTRYDDHDRRLDLAGSAPTVGVAADPDIPHRMGPPPGPPVPPLFGPTGSPPARSGRGSRGKVVVLVAVVALLVAIAGGAAWWLSRGSTSSAADAAPTAGPDAGVPQGNGPPVVTAATSPIGRSVDTPTVGQTVAANATPGYMEIAPNGKYAYIANREAGVLSVFDTTRNAVTGTIKVPEGGPQFVAFAPDGKRAYVSIFNNDRTVNIVGVLDTATSTFLTTIKVGVRPFALDVTPDGKRVYVPNHDSGSITVIDTATNAVINTIAVAPNPHWVDVSADGKTLYAANHESNVVSVIDTATDKVLKTIPVGQSPHSILRHPTRPLLFNVNYDSNTLSVIDTNSLAVVKTIPTGSHPQDISLAADGQHAYIASVDDNAIQVLNLKTLEVTARIPVGRSPTSIAISHDGRQGYVTNLADGTVTILNLAGTA